VKSYPETSSLLQTPRHNPSYFEVTSVLGHVIDYCVPANPYFPSQKMQALLAESLPDLLKYYPDYGPGTVAALSDITGIDPANILAVNGSTEVITVLVNSLMKGPILTDIPTFGRWTDLPVDIGKSLILFPRPMEQEFHVAPDEWVAFAKKSHVQSMVLCNPNNPTGSLNRRGELLNIIERLSHLDLIVIDESFMPFADEPERDSFEKMASRLPNVVVVKSMGKALGWHGIRLGYVVGHRQVIERLRPLIPYWNINGIAQYALSLVRDNQAAFFQSHARVVEDRRYLEQRLRKISQLRVFSSQANFVFFQIPDSCDGLDLRERLLKNHRLFVRECSNKVGSSSAFFRVAARPREDTDRLVAALQREGFRTGQLESESPA